MDPLPLPAYYAQLRENVRLTATATGRLEADRTRELLLRLLPGTGPLDVLVVGGGTGAHAAWLAALGHRVVLVDPVPEQVAVAAAVPGVTARHASLLDLAVVGRLDAATLGRVRGTLATGCHDPALGFTDAWFARTDTVVAEFAAAGLAGARTFGIEGPGFLGLRALEVAGLPVPDAVYAGVVAAARAVEEEPTALGAGSHLLTVATV